MLPQIGVPDLRTGISKAVFLLLRATPAFYKLNRGPGGRGKLALISSLQRQEVATVLRRGQWFGSLPAALQERIEQEIRLKTLPAGSVIFDQGQASTGLWAVVDGQVHLSEVLPGGSEFLMLIGGPGCWFGEAALLVSQSALVRARATTSVRLVVLPQEAFHRITDENSRDFAHFAALALGRYRILMQLLAHTSAMDAESFFRLRLATLVRNWRRDGSETPEIEIVVTQTEAARMFGLTRQTLNRYLHRLEGKGMIGTTYRSIRILEPELLEAECTLVD